MGLPPKERSVIGTLDRIVRSAAAKGAGSMKYGMPTYEFGARIVAFNAQRNYYSFYADPGIVKRYRDELKGLDCGKSCIRFRNIGDVPLSILGKIVHDCAK